MGRWKLDEWIFGEETLNRWDAERKIKSEFLTPYEREEMNKRKRKEQAEEDDKRKEDESFYKWSQQLIKYGCGYLFKLDEIPEVFKAEITKQCGGLEKDKLAEKETIELYVDKYAFGSKVHLREGGFEYVENEKGEPALRVYIQDLIGPSMGAGGD